MSQNIYDNNEFFDGYAQLGRSRHGLAGAPEWPALEEMLPPLVKAAVLDLGCGYGWFCRRAAEKGAAKVIGLDLSEKMLAKAAELTSGEYAGKISYYRADLGNLDCLVGPAKEEGGEPCGCLRGTPPALPRDGFDLVYSSLTLHYLEDITALFRSVHSLLRPGGSLVFSVEHAIYTAGLNPDWFPDRNGLKSWPVNHYLAEGKRSTDWIITGVLKQHRKIATYVNGLIEAGFILARLDEWGPTTGQVSEFPELLEERERPMLLLAKAIKKR